MARSERIAIDGMNSVDQGGLGVHQSRGSKMVRCDIDTQISWFDAHNNMRIDPVPRDLNGVPHRLCGIGGHYSPVSAFDGEAHDCCQCLLDNAERTTALEGDIERAEREREARARRLKRRVFGGD